MWVRGSSPRMTEFLNGAQTFLSAKNLTTKAQRTRSARRKIYRRGRREARRTPWKENAALRAAIHLRSLRFSATSAVIFLFVSFVPLWFFFSKSEKI
jgi:hypothetical protein